MDYQYLFIQVFFIFIFVFVPNISLFVYHQLYLLWTSFLLTQFVANIFPSMRYHLPIIGKFSEKQKKCMPPHSNVFQLLRDKYNSIWDKYESNTRQIFIKYSTNTNWIHDKYELTTHKKEMHKKESLASQQSWALPTLWGICPAVIFPAA